MELFWIPLAAFVIDAIFADPSFFPHPVQLIGKLLDKLEKTARKNFSNRFGGVLSLLILLLMVFVVVTTCIGIPYVGWIFALYFAWSGLALGSLLSEGTKAVQAVASGSLDDGRKAVSMLVSRDVSESTEEELYKTLAETISENFNDGIIAPFFWLVLSGPVGLWLYKATSTMDSMWGYKNEKWIDLGWAGAKFDDLLAYLPARFSAMFLQCTANLAGLGSGRGVWDSVARDAAKMESPNAGWPMAMAAHLYGRPMGGSAVYFGKVKEKPVLGVGDEAWDKATLIQLIKHIRLAAIFGCGLLWLAVSLLRLVF
ncbi:adenosylcobinamide-phosphate synthase CbiB [Halodesulfovibrio sp. MK-HDV]|jgi:adenosylcobinamide-phosphate synthase|uniref:adenosylcobinamide-phosphate synthase CbiB n=1 Tax=Halodesulfovibrio sp. MK-HDV TaxID=2599925 RepID=UPI0013707E5E|nr:adenosylcobinamide-phosphate synthase CbiB [Halodesulfovibrio sp. MK-HDV]KAF1075480.1 Cobalamin biosynthesis protein CobD [Halodesulfovibrio sp. MK-HDV]